MSCMRLPGADGAGGAAGPPGRGRGLEYVPDSGDGGLNSGDSDDLRHGRSLSLSGGTDRLVLDWLGPSRPIMKNGRLRSEGL